MNFLKICVGESEFGTIIPKNGDEGAGYISRSGHGQRYSPRGSPAPDPS
jgi:hypothetical protein